MNKNKSKAAYTTKWLNKNKQYWTEIIVRKAKQIVITKKDAPKIVLERVEFINWKRRLKAIEEWKLAKTIESKSMKR